MKYPQFVLSLIALCAVLVSSLAVSAQSSKVDKIEKAVRKIGVTKDITVVRSDGRWFYGSVEQIDSGAFTIYEIEQKTKIVFGFDQVDKVYKGYGPGGALQRDVNGHRMPPGKSRRGWLLAAAGAGALITILVIALSQDKS